MTVVDTPESEATLSIEVPELAASFWKLPLVAVIAAVVIVLLLRRAEWINGTWNQRWAFHWVPTLRIFPPMLLAVAPALLAQRVSNRWLALTMMAITLLALQIISVGMPLTPWSLNRLIGIVASPQSTGYFSDAFQLGSTAASPQWLVAHFPQLAGFCALHSREKPPGQILYYLAWQRAYGAGNLDEAALAGGLVIATLASAGVFTTYGLARAAGLSDPQARSSATAFALLPGMLAFCPSFDQVYAGFTGLIVGAWLLALSASGRRRYIAAFVCGAATAVASFLAYSPLTLGAICAAAGIYQLNRGRIDWRSLSAAVATVIAPIALFYAALWLWSGFDPLTMFRHAYANEMSNQAIFPLPRRYPITIPGDLKGFMDGSGWVCLPVILCGIVRARRLAAGPMVWMAVGQIGVVCLSGLLRCETMRVWLFLQPLAMIPLGIELAAWPTWRRVGFFLIFAIVTIAISQNLMFMDALG